MYSRRKLATTLYVALNRSLVAYIMTPENLYLLEISGQKALVIIGIEHRSFESKACTQKLVTRVLSVWMCGLCI